MANELDIRCAQALGWEEEQPPAWYVLAEPHWRTPTEAYRPTPAFSSDPAMAAFLEDEIERRGLQAAYIDALLPDYHSFEPMTRTELFSILRATPEQRAQAFLRALDHAA